MRIKAHGIAASLLSALFAVAALPALLSAHDLQTKVDLLPPFVVVSASYEGTEAASFAEVTVHAPASANLKADAFQTGRTDFDGKFVFLPISPGDWRVIVDDEMGHRVEAVAAVADAADSAPGMPRPLHSAPGDGRGTGERLLIGLSILFGAAGLLYGWTARRRNARAV